MRSTLPTLALTLLTTLTTTANAYAKPLPCTGTCTNAHDPSLIRRSDGTYFRFSTGGKIAMHSAPALTGPWTYLGAALPSGSTINNPGADDLWAPDVLQVDDTYYMYYTVSTFGSQESVIGVATSTTLDKWTDLGSSGVESRAGDEFNAIDANVVRDGGVFHMSFGSFWRDLFQVRMSDPPRSRAGNATAPTNIAFVPGGDHAQEAPFVYKYGEFYYLFFSVGKCCGFDRDRPAAGAEYKIQVCRSSLVDGAYVDKEGTECTNGGGTTVLESHDNIYGPGGQGVMNDPSQGPVLYYHYVDTTIGFADGQKQFGVNTLDFSSGWPVV